MNKENLVYIAGEAYCGERYDENYIKIHGVFLLEDAAKSFVGLTGHQYSISSHPVICNMEDVKRKIALSKLTKEERRLLGLE